MSEHDDPKVPAVDGVPDANDRQRSLAHLANDQEAMRASYGKPSLKAIINDRYAFGCSLFAAMGGLLFGIDQGLVSVILVMPRFLERFHQIDGTQDVSAGFNKGILTAMIELGALVGALCAGFVADKFSRRGAIRVGVIFFIIGSAIQTGSISYDMLVVGRLIGGVGIGFLSSTCPVYISELSPPHIRGILLGLEEFAIVAGICIAYYVTFGTRLIDSEWCYRLPFLLQIIPGFVLLAGAFVLPPSPRWLAMAGRNEESLLTLAKIRRRHPDDALVQAEWLEIRGEAELHDEIRKERHPTHQTGSFKDQVALEAWGWIDTFRPGCWKRTVVGILLMAFQQLVGINALIYYAPTLFEQLGLNYDDRLNLSGVANLCQLAGVFLSFFFIDKIGRRPLLTFGSLGMMVCMVIVGVLTAIFSSDWPAHKSEARAAVAFLNIYMVVFGLSWGPIPWSMPSELFPSSLRAKGVAWSTVSNWLFNFIIGLIVPPMVDATGYGAFIFFACWAFVSALFAIFVVPETKGKTLEQLDTLFNDRSGTADEQRRTRINNRLAAEASARLERSSAYSASNASQQNHRLGNAGDEDAEDKKLPPSAA